jgi:hypoxanthine phosphoribosyltransferase
MPVVREEDSRRLQAKPHDRDRRWRICSGKNPQVCRCARLLPGHLSDSSHNRSFLKQPGSPNIPIQAIGLSLYEDLGKNDPVEEIGTKVTRTQWLDLSSLEMATLVGKNILIVDEVDDTRTTLEYAVKELQKDVEIAREKLGKSGEKTTFSIFVLHV